MAERNKNKKNLTLPLICGDLLPVKSSSSTLSMDDHGSKLSPTNLEERLKRLQFTDTQEKRIHQFLAQREQIGEINENDLEKICDLGCENRDTIVKVKHKPSGIIMQILVEFKRDQLIKELKVLHNCNSPYTVGLYGASIYSDKNVDVSLFMEYMDGLSLDNILKKSGRISESILGKITIAVLNGLKYLKKECNILHRDIRPSNILVNSQGEIKLCNFGVSVQSFKNTNDFRCYISPERLLGYRCDLKADLWSLGMSLVEMATGRYPIPPPTAEEYIQLLSTESVDQTASSRPTSHVDTPITTEPKMQLAIFELLNYIIHEAPPTLPKGIWTEQFTDFVELCLKKNTEDRASLATLLVYPFVEVASNQEIDFAGWVKEQIEKQ